MQTVRTATFKIISNPEIFSLLETFRKMVNEAIRIGFDRKPRTRFQLIGLVYEDFKRRYGLHTHYILNACECAFAMLRNRKWKKKPHAKHLFLKLDNQTYQLSEEAIRIPIKPRQFLTVPIKGGAYQLTFLRDKTLKRGSITLQSAQLSVAFSKEVVEMPTLRNVAYDLNEKSLVSSDGGISDLSKVASISHQYSRIMMSVARARQSDDRIKGDLLSKYGAKKRERVKQALHVISRKVVEEAKAKKAKIVLEDLKNILKSHRKGNREGRRMRGRLHRWPFHMLQNQIEYKAKWEGIPVMKVRAANTSKRCSQCGFINKALKYEREWQCPVCGVILDRDLNAARNILARSWVKEAAEVRRSDERLADEGMVQLATATRS